MSQKTCPVGHAYVSTLANLIETNHIYIHRAQPFMSKVYIEAPLYINNIIPGMFNVKKIAFISETVRERAKHTEILDHIYCQ